MNEPDDLPPSTSQEFGAQEPSDADETATFVDVESHNGSSNGHSHVRVDDRPEVQLGLDMHRVVHETAAALAKSQRIYQRSHELVTVVGSPIVIAGEPVSRRPVMRSLNEHSLLPQLTQHVKITKKELREAPDGKKFIVWVEAKPPADVRKCLLNSADWPGIRDLDGVTETPFIKPDGTIMQEAGYDPITRTLYYPSASYISVKEDPTVEDAHGALELLREVVCDFPFAKPEYESAWLAGVLTMLARPAINGPVPVFAVDATTRGTGKSRLVDAAMRIALGHDAPRMPMPQNDEEMRKLISSIVLEGETAVCIDNIAGQVAFPSLDAAVTSTIWKDRILSTNRTIRAAHRAVWWLTGNNLQLGGDLGRRTMHVRMESSLENPEDRTDFKHDVIPWVAKERKRLVAAALTLLRAFFVAGAPKLSAIWGSFEEWSNIIPSALVWAGMADPVKARASADPSMDDGRRTLAVLIDGLRRLCPVDISGNSTPITAKDVINVLYPDRDPRDGPLPPDGYEALRDAIEQETAAQAGRKPEPRRLGKWFQRARGRVINKWCIERVEGHSVKWRVVPSLIQSGNVSVSIPPPSDDVADLIDHPGLIDD